MRANGDDVSSRGPRRRAGGRLVRWARSRARLVCICLLAVLALETFGFNHYFWSTVDNQPIDRPVMVDGSGNSVEYGAVYDVGNDGVTFTIYPGGDEGAYVDVDSIDMRVMAATQQGTAGIDMDSNSECSMVARIVVYSEGAQDGYSSDTARQDYVGPQEVPWNTSDTGRLVCPAVPESMYRPLQLAGKVNKIELTLDTTTSSVPAVVFSDVMLNERVPLRFNAWRVLFWFLVAFGVACLFSRRESAIAAFMRDGVVPVTVDGATADSQWTVARGAGTSTAYDRLTYGQLCSLLAAMAGMMVLVTFLQLNGADNGRGSGEHYGYANLARSLLAGHLDLTVTDPSMTDLSEYANPYDEIHRAKQGARVPWDTAYYDGRYYLYFGIVPALLLYVPCRFLTGADMPEPWAQSLVCIATVAGMFLLVDELRRRLCPRMPRRLFVLMACVLSLAPSCVIMVQRASVYDTALGSGVAFVTWGLWLWLRSVRGVDSRGRGLSVWRAALGSLCMALAVGCRPTMALYSLLAFPVFWRVVVRPRSNWWRVLLAVLPYVPVAAGLMWYNAARFGSPFEFGARYQLTAIDALHQGVHLSRVPLGLWYYLANPVQFTPEFPYTYPRSVATRYTGMLYIESQTGGAFVLIPLTLVLLVPRIVCTARKSRALYASCMAGAVCMAGFDAVYGGVIMRYQIDLRLFLVVAAAAVSMEWLQDAAQRGDAAVAMRRYRIIGVLLVVTAVMDLLTVYSPYEVTPWYKPGGSPVFWFRSWDFFELVRL